jgi:enamine deaminase RidA (YjgF/YER057c/UK114 family)
VPASRILAPMERMLTGVAGLYRDVPYSYAAIVPGGGTVFTAGACPLDEDGRIVAPGDVEAQARVAIRNLLAALQAAGCRAGDVVKTTVYVASSDGAELGLAWREVERAFGSDGPPSTLLGVAALGWPDQLFEIEAIAALPD